MLTLLGAVAVAVAPAFKAGVASAEAAVRRLREEYYEEIIKDDTQG